MSEARNGCERDWVSSACDDRRRAHNHGRNLSRTGDGTIIEFRSVVDAVRCSIEGAERHGRAQCRASATTTNPVPRCIHLGAIIEETDGDLMGDGINIASRLENIREPRGLCISSAAYEQVRDGISAEAIDPGDTELKNIPRPIQVCTVGLNSGLETSRAEISSQRSHAPRLSGVAADAEAIVWRRRAIEMNRDIIGARFLMAGPLALLGQIDEAKAAAQVGLTLHPRLTIGRFHAGAMDKDPNYLAQRDRPIDAMRKAGVAAG